MDLKKILDYDEVVSVAELDVNIIDFLYRDRYQAERFVFAGDQENWRTIGSQLDGIHGGDWMPVSNISKLVLLEKVVRILEDQKTKSTL